MKNKCHSHAANIDPNQSNNKSKVKCNLLLRFKY